LRSGPFSPFGPRNQEWSGFDTIDNEKPWLRLKLQGVPKGGLER